MTSLKCYLNNRFEVELTWWMNDTLGNSLLTLGELRCTMHRISADIQIRLTRATDV